MARQAWTRDQVARLRELAGRHPLRDVARHMGRSHSSVKNATHKFDISCGRAWTPEGPLAVAGPRPARVTVNEG